MTETVRQTTAAQESPATIMFRDRAESQAGFRSTATTASSRRLSLTQDSTLPTDANFTTMTITSSQKASRTAL